MKKKMILITLISLSVMLGAGALYHFTGNRLLFSTAITFGTIFYHLGMRLAVGSFIDAKYHNQMNYTGWWFRERAFERSFYEKIRVQKWKGWMPTFTPKNFQLRRDAIPEIVQATCQAEVVHEVNMVLSFVPVIFSIWFGSLEVFLITSCIAFIFDGLFVMIQRYNRPRLIQLIRRKKSNLPA